MAKRQREWARRKRTELLAQLGGRCARCGTTDNLEFDCIIPQGDAHHKKEWSARMSFYRAQAKAGNIQVLCSGCNNLKSLDENCQTVCPRTIEMPF